MGGVSMLPTRYLCGPAANTHAWYAVLANAFVSADCCDWLKHLTLGNTCFPLYVMYITMS